MFVQDIYIASDEADSLCKLNPNHAEAVGTIARELFDTLGYTNRAFPDNLYPLGMLGGGIPLDLQPQAIHPVSNPSGILLLPANVFNVIVEDWLIGNQYVAQVSEQPNGGIHISIPGKIGNADATLNLGLSAQLKVEFMTIYSPNGFFTALQLMDGLQKFRIWMKELLPTISGLVMTWNTRGRDFVWLGPKKPMQVRGQIMGVSVLQVDRSSTTTLNPRYNPTDITRSPHIRAAHWRNYADGSRKWIPACTIHEEDFVPGVHDRRILK